MPQKIDGLTYPKTAAELLANRDLMRAVLQTYPSPEVRNRVKFLIKPPKAANAYVDYIAPNAPNRIDLPNHIKAMATDLIKNNDHEVRLWQGVADLVEANCRNLIEQKIIPEFFNEKTSRVFKNLHVVNLAAAGEKKFGKVDNVMARLNLTDRSAVRGLFAEMIRGDRKGMHDLALYAIRKAKLNATPINVIDAIKTGKGLTNSGAFEVDVKKLSVCGFANPKDKKLRNRVEDMVNAWMSGDKTTAKQIFQLIQKDEPKDSFVKKDTIESLFKSFKKFKVVMA